MWNLLAVSPSFPPTFLLSNQVQTLHTSFLCLSLLVCETGDDKTLLEGCSQKRT